MRLSFCLRLVLTWCGCLSPSATDPSSQRPGPVHFTDTDLEGSHLLGTLTLLAAADEAGISHYSVHFASAPDGPPLPGSVADFPTGSPGAVLSRQLRARLPAEIAAGADFYLAALARNATAMLGRGPAARCRDLAVPTERAGGARFLDEDARPGLIGGTVHIVRAADETDIESYIVRSAVREVSAQGTHRWRWVQSLGEVHKAAGVLQVEAVEVCRCTPARRGGICSSPLRLVGDGMSLPECARACEGVPQCEYFVAGKANSTRSGRCYQVRGACAAVDPDPSYDIFTLTRGLVQIQGNGSLSACECDTIPGRLERTLLPVVPSVSIPRGTPLSGASHIVVITKNADGDMSQGRQPERWVSASLADLKAPTTPVLGLAFDDEDAREGLLYGRVRFAPPEPLGGQLEYRVYLASRSGGGGEVRPLRQGAPVAVLSPSSVQPSGSRPEELSVVMGGPCPGPGPGPGAAPGGAGACSGAQEAPRQPPSNGSAANGSNGSNASALPRPPAPPRCGCAAAGATHLLVRVANGSGEVEQASRHVKLVDRTGRPPRAEVRRLAFVDADGSPGLLAGRVRFAVPEPEPGDVAAYRLYFQGEGGERVELVRRGGRPPWIAEVAATGLDGEAIIPVGTIIPSAAQRLAVVASNPDGEGPFGRGMAIRDVGSGSGEWKSPIWEVIIMTVSVLACCCCLWLWLLIKTRLKACLLRWFENEFEGGSKAPGKSAGTSA